jgi:hypothetical protein
MLGPKGIITVGPSFEHAFECDVECVEHAEALAHDEALVAYLEKLANEAPDSPNKHAESFEDGGHTKVVPLDPSTPEGKVLVDFLITNADIFAWSRTDMSGIPREVAEHSIDILPNSKPHSQRQR